MADSLLETRAFPEEYEKDVVDVIYSMTLDRGKGLKILGSSSIKAIKYSQDYDLYQKCNVKMESDDQAIKHYCAELKFLIVHLLKKNKVYIGDIKCGTVTEWEIIPSSWKIEHGDVSGYRYEKAIEKLEILLSKQVISKTEFDEAKSYLKHNPTPFDFLQMKDNIKFNVVRWKPKDVLNGYVDYRGKRCELLKMLPTESLTKMDVVAYVQNGYHDFSCIYEFRNGDKNLNGLPFNVNHSLKCDIIYYEKLKKYFKMTKRLFSLANVNKNGNLISKLTEVLNDDDLGSMYVIMGDISTLLWILENEKIIETTRIKNEINDFIPKIKKLEELANKINQKKLIQIIHNLVHENKTDRNKMESQLSLLSEIISHAVNSATEAKLKGIKVLPLSPTFKP